MVQIKRNEAGSRIPKFANFVSLETDNKDNKRMEPLPLFPRLCALLNILVKRVRKKETETENEEKTKTLMKDGKASKRGYFTT